MADARWRFRQRQSGQVAIGPLVALWEVDGDPISDDYTPDEMTAAELLARWAAQAAGRYADDLVPIHWFVRGVETATLETMPFQFNHFAHRGRHDDFLTFFDWPVNDATGEPLNWLALPVADKRWGGTRGDKGGFIQVATGWKPSPLQPFVWLPSLTTAPRGL